MGAFFHEPTEGGEKSESVLDFGGFPDVAVR